MWTSIPKKSWARWERHNDRRVNGEKSRLSITFSPDGDVISGSSCGAGVYSPGTTHVPLRLITCQVAAGEKYSHVDDPLDLGKTADHRHDTRFHGYRHVFRCAQLAEAAFHNNVLIAGDFCQFIEDWQVLLHRAVVELGCKAYAYVGMDHDCFVAYPNLLVDGEGFDIKRPRFPKNEGGRHYAYYMRIAWQLESQLS